MHFKGSIIITDPCYLINEDNDDDWDLCEYGYDMGSLGITKCIVRDTMYGDWSCSVFNTDKNEKIGEFCADAGMVGVFLLDEVLKYNPHFDYHTEKPHTTAMIKDFDGEVTFEIENDGVIVVGRGNVNFKSSQTGF